MSDNEVYGSVIMWYHYLYLFNYPSYLSVTLFLYNMIENQYIKDFFSTHFICISFEKEDDDKASHSLVFLNYTMRYDQGIE